MATLTILIAVEWARKAYGLIRYALSTKEKKHIRGWPEYVVGRKIYSHLGSYSSV